jgi:hypothetical protein
MKGNTSKLPIDVFWMLDVGTFGYCSKSLLNEIYSFFKEPYSLPHRYKYIFLHFSDTCALGSNSPTNFNPKELSSLWR